jgi:hypothetical protein
MRNVPGFAIAVVSLAVGPASAVVVDHSDVDMVATLPQNTMTAIGQQKWLFTHASVGGNMVQGMETLHGQQPARYCLDTTYVGYDSAHQEANDPPTPTQAGQVYECQRGNPGWQAKFTIFANSITSAGWHDGAVGVVMDKLCYIDQNANATAYVDSMSTLEAAYPHTVFVYTTMPLMTGSGSENILRNNYNTAVRTFCTTNHKLLFDIADIEAYDPSGVAQTFTSGGKIYQRLYDGYTSDGGHLSNAGQLRVAAGWYAVAAFIAVRGAPGDLNQDGCVDLADFDRFTTCFSGPGINHDGDLDGDRDVDQADFGVFQRCVSGNRPANPACKN